MEKYIFKPDDLMKLYGTIFLRTRFFVYCIVIFFLKQMFERFFFLKWCIFYIIYDTKNSRCFISHFYMAVGYFEFDSYLFLIQSVCAFQILKIYAVICYL